MSAIKVSGRAKAALSAAGIKRAPAPEGVLMFKLPGQMYETTKGVTAEGPTPAALDILDSFAEAHGLRAMRLVPTCSYVMWPATGGAS